MKCKRFYCKSLWLYRRKWVWITKLQALPVKVKVVNLIGHINISHLWLPSYYFISFVYLFQFSWTRLKMPCLDIKDDLINNFNNLKNHLRAVHKGRLQIFAHFLNPPPSPPCPYVSEFWYPPPPRRPHLFLKNQHHNIIIFFVNIYCYWPNTL